MTAVTFKKWFKGDSLIYITPESVIVMESVSCHSKQCDKPPGTNCGKTDTMAWLSSGNIPHTAT
jgi:hypothetical protein